MWYVIRTNIKSEDKAERNLRDAGFSTYAPWQKFERYNRRKNVHITRELRLCPRYLFLDVGAISRERTPWGVIRGCEGVESVLGVNGLPMPLSPLEERALQHIQQAEREHAFDETRAGKLYRREIGKTKKETTRMKFPVGSKVRINDGPFATFSGEVTNVTGRGYIEVITMMFGRLTPVEVEPGQVEQAA
jgi:transcription antitermination factor NusG